MVEFAKAILRNDRATVFMLVSLSIKPDHFHKTRKTNSRTDNTLETYVYNREAAVVHD